MRILRGQSNLEVSSQGFALFVAGLVLATFAGGALRTVLNSAQFHERIVAELKNRFPKHEFQVGRSEVMLSRGIWPALGVRVNEVTFKQDVCGKLSFVLTLPRATLPLDIFSLLRGRVRLNDVEIDGGELHLDYRPCVPSGEAVAAAASVASPQSINMPRMDFHQAARVLDGVELKNFSVTYEKSPTWKLFFKSAYLSLGDETSLQALVDVQKSLPFGTLSHPVEFDLRGDHNVLHWNFNAEFKEGHVQIDGSVDMNNQAGLVKVNFRQVPLRDLSSEVYQAALIDREFNLKSMWLSCSLKWEGQLTNYAATPVTMRDCRIEGSYGHAELETADLSLKPAELFKEPARFKVNKFQIGPALEALKREVLPAVLSRLGVWTGTLEVSNENSWSMDGVLEGLEIVFSNQSVLGKQVIDSVHTKLHSLGGKTVARVDEVRIHDGEFSGTADFDLNKDLRDGTFHVAFEKLALAPQIQKLLIGGSMTPLKGQGQGVLSAGELSQWSGGFSVGEMKGEGWKSEDLQLRSRKHGDAFEVDFAAKSAVADNNWRFFPQVKMMHGDAADPIGWHDLSAHFEIQKSGGTIRDWRAQENSSVVVWKGKGNWVRDGDFTGIVNTVGEKKNRNFTLRGERGSLTVVDKAGDGK